MPTFNCAHCGTLTSKKYSKARYCSRSCATLGTQRHLVGGRVKKYSDEELLDVLRDLATTLGRTPAKRDMVKPLPSDTAYQLRFGSWNGAVLKAGLEPNVKTMPAGDQSGRDSVSLITRFRVMRRDGFRCVYCGAAPRDGVFLTIDHAISVADGGSEEDSNLKTACWPCNLGKGSASLQVTGL